MLTVHSDIGNAGRRVVAVNALLIDKLAALKAQNAKLRAEVIALGSTAPEPEPIDFNEELQELTEVHLALAVMAAGDVPIAATSEASAPDPTAPVAPVIISTEPVILG